MSLAFKTERKNEQADLKIGKLENWKSETRDTRTGKCAARAIFVRTVAVNLVMALGVGYWWLSVVSVVPVVPWWPPKRVHSLTFGSFQNVVWRFKSQSCMNFGLGSGGVCGSTCGGVWRCVAHPDSSLRCLHRAEYLT